MVSAPRRLAPDGSDYAAYFGVAITVQKGSCVDIHEGDRMQVADAQGDLPGGRESDSSMLGRVHAGTGAVVGEQLSIPVRDHS